MKLRWFAPLCLCLLLSSAAVAGQADVERYNKEVITHFIARINSSDDPAVVARQAAPHIIQHDPLVEPGREGTAGWIRSLRARTPAESMTVKHLLADGDLVFVHSQVSATPANEMSGTNRYDFYRLDRGWIVEHWSVKAPAPLRSASGNSVFSDLYTYEQRPAAVSDERVALNRLFVKSLSEEVFGKRNFGLLDRMWAPGYIQHNPYIGNGRAALASVLQFIARPGSSYRVVRAMAEGDLAVVCSHNVPPGGDVNDEFAGAAVCDMYRVDNFELVEHWDVAQPVPRTSLSGNSMFSSLYRGRQR